MAEFDLMVWVPKDNVKCAISSNSPYSFCASEVQRPQFILHWQILLHPLSGKWAIELGYRDGMVVLLISHKNLIPSFPLELRKSVSHLHDLGGSKIVPSVRVN